MKNSLLLLLLVIPISLLQAQSPHLILASDVYPPFTDSTGHKAVAVDLVKQALERTGATVECHIVVFEEVLRGLGTGSLDGSVAFWKSEERMEEFFFSEPYLTNQLILVGLAKSDVSQKSLKELSGKRVGIVANYDYDVYEAKTAGVEFVTNESDQRNLGQLISGKLDYMLVDALLISYMLRYQVNDVSAMLAIGEDPILVRPLHLVLRKDVPNAERIIEDFNTAYREMILDGTVNEILGMNAIQADIDGDGKMEIVLANGPVGKQRPKSLYAQAYERQQRTAEEKMEAQATERIYLDGKYYDNWEALPAAVRQEALPEVLDDPYEAGVKLRLESR